jgi:hypothetical protein
MNSRHPAAGSTEKRDLTALVGIRSLSLLNREALQCSTQSEEAKGCNILRVANETRSFEVDLENSALSAEIAES